MDPYDRTTEMPNVPARSLIAGGTVDPPSPMRVMCDACSGPKVGWSSSERRKNVEPEPAATSSAIIACSTAPGSHTSM